MNVLASWLFTPPAVSALGDRLLYAKSLVRVAELRNPPPMAAPAGVAADGGKLSQRIRRVLGLPVGDDLGRRAWLGGAVALALIGLALAAQVQGDVQPPPSGAGVVLEPDGMPAGGAALALATPNGNVTLRRHGFHFTGEGHDLGKTADDGSYHQPAEFVRYMSNPGYSSAHYFGIVGFTPGEQKILLTRELRREDTDGKPRPVKKGENAPQLVLVHAQRP
jgi:hypothetical protein